MSEWDRKLAEFDFELPEDRIARRPAKIRSSSRLLHWLPESFGQHAFSDLPQLLHAGDLLVLNDSKVLPARLFGNKRPGGGRVEILLERRLAAGRWSALVRPGRRLPEGSIVELDGGLELRVGEALRGAARVVEAEGLLEHAERHGHMPLPPYLDREDDSSDRERYQTVYAREMGSVAAPTAGLHFDEALLAGLAERGVSCIPLTLHVGLGTFAPLDAAAWDEKQLHAEWLRVPRELQRAVVEAKERGGRVIAAGTTACRALESWARVRGVRAGEDFEGETRLFLRPGDRFEVVDLLLTNFHLPRSSLLLLVAAFAGERWRAAYRMAVDCGYRFYSYGDANLIERAVP